MKGIKLESPFEDCLGYEQIQQGRKYMYLWNTTTKKGRSISFARYLVSVKEGRILAVDEHVDHIDGDNTNDAIDNLQILSPAENNRKSVIQNGLSKVEIVFRCPVCKTIMVREAQRVVHKLDKGIVPTCSRRCGYIKGVETRNSKR